MFPLSWLRWWCYNYSLMSKQIKQKHFKYILFIVYQLHNKKLVNHGCCSKESSFTYTESSGPRSLFQLIFFSPENGLIQELAEEFYLFIYLLISLFIYFCSLGENKDLLSYKSLQKCRAMRSGWVGVLSCHILPGLWGFPTEASLGQDSPFYFIET